MVRNRSVPAARVIPVLTYPDVPEASRWLCEAFGFRERLRIATHRAQLAYGDGAIILTNRAPDADGVPGSFCHVHIAVDDARAHHDHAVEHGATILQEPTDFPYGERQYTAVDPGGHNWVFSESIADVEPEDWGGTAVDLN
jgi:uncharacterized glyoxalase superfamily protein PhnB